MGVFPPKKNNIRSVFMLHSVTGMSMTWSSQWKYFGIWVPDGLPQILWGMRVWEECPGQRQKKIQSVFQSVPMSQKIFQ